ncbi:MAG: hypothetical protein ABIP50_00040 [Candidatus Saccharimonadales bacterium]
MQPENSRAPIGPEQLPVTPANNAERIPVLPTPESGLETGLERTKQAAEANAAVADAASYAAPIMVPVTPTIDPTTPTSVGPLVAEDQDVIEKEWVDKAKQIIGSTKDDPHGRTARVNDLQKEYLQKRFGKVLGASGE